MTLLSWTYLLVFSLITYFSVGKYAVTLQLSAEQKRLYHVSFSTINERIIEALFDENWNEKKCTFFPQFWAYCLLYLSKTPTNVLFSTLVFLS